MALAELAMIVAYSNMSAMDSFLFCGTRNMLKRFQVNPTKIVSTTAHFHKDHFWKFSGSVWPGGST